MDEKQLKALCNPTRLRILGLLAEKPMTNTEIYEKLKKQGILYRESVFKSLEKLKSANLIKREFVEKIGYKYQLNFKEIKISQNLSISSLAH